MYYTVKTLLDSGKSVSSIASTVGIDRKTVRKIRDSVKDGIKPPEFHKPSILDNYKEYITSLLNEDGLNGVLIHRRLNEEYGLGVSYSCVKKYVRKLKAPVGPYVPLISPPGHEAQVDFGYAGIFSDRTTKKKHKVWVFSMRLSHSRYDYYELVKKQDVATFIRCHINAFEYFGGVPAVVKLDNLKAGVLKADIYEPVFQKEYASMLYHYGSSPIACKVRYPQEKGKVESSIKYVSNNFLKGLKTTELGEAKLQLRIWMNQICNVRIHGTTRKVPLQQFQEKEKSCLKPLPERRYEVYHIEERKVNTYGHILFKTNFYSVPYKYVSETVTIKSNGSIIRILNGTHDEIAIHQLCHDSGEFITNRFHNPKLLNSLAEKEYTAKSNEIGINAHNFFLNIRAKRPESYKRIMRGIFALNNKHGSEIVDAACRRAVDFSSFSYLSVKKICEEGLYDREESATEAIVCGGYGNDLGMYDVFMTGGRI